MKMNDQIDEKTLDEKHAKDGVKKVFNFTKEDLDNLKPMDDVTNFTNMMTLIGGMAQNIKNSYVTNTVLPRLGVVNSKDTEFIYDTKENRIIVYEPKTLCSDCKIRKAEFKYKEQVYCAECIEKVKQQLAKPLEKVEEAKEEPKIEVKEEPKEKKKAKK